MHNEWHGRDPFPSAFNTLYRSTSFYHQNDSLFYKLDIIKNKPHDLTVFKTDQFLYIVKVIMRDWKLSENTLFSVNRPSLTHENIRARQFHKASQWLKITKIVSFRYLRKLPGTYFFKSITQPLPIFTISRF